MAEIEPGGARNEPAGGARNEPGGARNEPAMSALNLEPPPLLRQ